MESPFTLKDKVAFVTGSTRGIGWATAELMASLGANVVINGRSDAAVQARATEIRDRHGVTCLALPGDASELSVIRQAYREIFGQFKRLDILVNNAGTMGSAVIGMISDDAIRQTFAINTIAVVHHVQEAARLMGRRNAGSIVNLASIVGDAGAEGQMVYAASKSALVGLTRSAAKELAPKGIRVNAVAPGLIRTDLLSALPKEKVEQLTASIRLGRLGEPEEVARAIAFLCSDYASYVTGHVLDVDGGMVL